MTKNVEVIFNVDVTVDETKFTKEFLDNFSKFFQKLDNLQEHIEHIAVLGVNGQLSEFTEGYGTLADMGIKVKINDCLAEMEKTS